MDLKKIITGTPKEKLTWGTASALWDICRYKIVGIPILDIFEAQAKDPDLKQACHYAIKNVMLPHIKAIQDFFEKEALTPPHLPERKILGNMEPNAIITDENIARAIRETLRFGIDIEARGLMETVREDAWKLISDIMKDDKNAAASIIELKQKKNWLFITPSV